MNPWTILNTPSAQMTPLQEILSVAYLLGLIFVIGIVCSFWPRKKK